MPKVKKAKSRPAPTRTQIWAASQQLKYGQAQTGEQHTERNDSTMQTFMERSCANEPVQPTPLEPALDNSHKKSKKSTSSAERARSPRRTRTPPSAPPLGDAIDLLSPMAKLDQSGTSFAAVADEAFSRWYKYEVNCEKTPDHRRAKKAAMRLRGCSADAATRWLEGYVSRHPDIEDDLDRGTRTARLKLEWKQADLEERMAALSSELAGVQSQLDTLDEEAFDWEERMMELGVNC